MPAYWWECEKCKKKRHFSDVTDAKSITHFIWNILMPSDWNQELLVEKCASCSDQMRIAYICPRNGQNHLMIKYIIGLAAADQYISMLWETIPDGDGNETLLDFKCLNGRNVFGLSRSAILTRQNMVDIIKKYSEKTGNKLCE